MPARLGGFAEIGSLNAAGGEQAGIVFAYTELVYKTRRHFFGQLGHLLAGFLQLFVGNDDGQQVGVGEIAVIVRVFFQAHHAGFALVGVKQHGRLLHLAAVFQNLDLRFHFVVNRLLQKAEGV